MNDILIKLGNIGIVPVVALDRAEDALKLGEALMRGGIPCAEVTFRTDAAEESIRILTNSLPEMITGAGTVLTTDQVDRAVAAGAKFIVSPGYNPRVVDYCVSRNIPVVPGCSTPSDIEMALEAGLDVVKFFPAEAAGGLPMIKAMSAPYGGVKFMPTGGINASNICNYLAFEKIIACGGSWMVDKKLVAAGNFEEIERLSREAVDTILGFELAHVGLNIEDPDRAAADADRLNRLFGFERKDGNSSIFAGKGLELTKVRFPGANGHVAVATNSIERAMYHLEMRGAKFDPDSIKKDEKGRIKAVYLAEEFGGMAFHLVRK